MEYRDDTPITQEDIDKLYAAISVGDLEQAAQKLAQWVKEKMMGEQTRKSLALWAILQARITEYLINNTDNFEDLMNNLKSELLERQGDVEKRQTDVENQFNAVVANATKDSEVILARDSQIYGTFPTLDGRFERLESIVSQWVPMGFTVTLKHNQNRKPKVAVSYVEYAFGTEPNGFGTGPAGSFGGYHNRDVQCMVEYPDLDTCIIHLPRSEALNGKPVFEIDAWRLIDGYKTLTFDLGENIDTTKALAGNSDNQALIDQWHVEKLNLLGDTTNLWKNYKAEDDGLRDAHGRTVLLEPGTYTYAVTVENIDSSRKADIKVKDYAGGVVGRSKKLSSGQVGRLTVTFKVTTKQAYYLYPLAFEQGTQAGNYVRYKEESLFKGSEDHPWSLPDTDTVTVPGGVNLIKHTSNELTPVTTQQNGIFTIGTPTSDVFNTLPKYQGQSVALRVWIEKPTSLARIQIWTNNGALYGTPVQAGESGYSTVTGVLPTGFTNWNIVISGQAGVSFSYKDLKLELGTVATPWSPAPEDLRKD